VGAELLPGGVHFRVWAPRCRRVDVVLEEGGDASALQPEPGGYFSGLVDQAKAGSRYRFRLDGESSYPDPASRFQPEGPHGASEIVDPAAFQWTDQGCTGVRIEGQVIYEMHVGTFTAEGTWEAARRELPELARLGITVVEMMPIADFPGDFGWGYDGVDLFAPCRLYGRPDDLRRFVNDAHATGLAVILDVVYNHLGPDGNYLREFSPSYFSTEYDNEWGDALNFDGKDSGAVREFFTSNARYWIEEFHFDGLRLDATQQIFDRSAEHIIKAVTSAARQTAGSREIIVVAENEEQKARLARPPAEGGYGVNGLWNDDFHHAAKVALTGKREAYYTDYRGSPQELISALKHGFLYQGQRYKWQKQCRGTGALDLRPAQFVIYLENHDQVANSSTGTRLSQLAQPARLRAITALLLLARNTPMLFQGQEFGSSAPFRYFADHKPDLAEKVRSGRADFLSQFPSLKSPEAKVLLPDPGARETFLQCKLNLAERLQNQAIYDLHKDLLRLRREDPVLADQQSGGLDGAVLGTEVFALRFFGGREGGRGGKRAGDRLLLVNLGADLDFEIVPEPLLAPVTGMRWEVLWSSESFRYGGSGIFMPDPDQGWRIQGPAATLLYPAPRGEDRE